MLARLLRDSEVLNLPSGSFGHDGRTVNEAYRTNWGKRCRELQPIHVSLTTSRGITGCEARNTLQGELCSTWFTHSPGGVSENARDSSDQGNTMTL